MEAEKVVHVVDLGGADAAQWLELLHLLAARPEGPPAPPPHRRPRAQGRARADGHGAHQGGRAPGRAIPVQPRGLPAGRAGRGVPPREDRRGAGRHLQPPAALPPHLQRRQGLQQQQQGGGGGGGGARSPVCPRRRRVRTRSWGRCGACRPRWWW
jgi:hypothetical protein